MDAKTKKRIEKIQMTIDESTFHLDNVDYEMYQALTEMQDAKDHAEAEAESVLSEIVDFEKFPPKGYALQDAIDNIQDAYDAWNLAHEEWLELGKEYKKTEKKIATLKAKLKELKKGKK